MAKRGRKPKTDQGPRVVKTTADEFQKAMAEATRQKESARTYCGYQGAHVKNYCERSGFSPKAFKIVQGFHNIADEFKRDDIIREVLMGIELMGYGSQGDLFDDVRKKVAATQDAAWEVAKLNPTGTPGLPLDEAEKAFKRDHEPAVRWLRDHEAEFRAFMAQHGVVVNREEVAA